MKKGFLYQKSLFCVDMVATMVVKNILQNRWTKKFVVQA
ncbi:hypothetical protein GEOBRER4_n2536 [Citrifermentans bremense]|uniref:Uncharacterized protein n=1 Tax=Citrifermentans bremense TaxID=60035 RepID=A0A7R7FSX4_9BACT|nr:hypothetical protein GEOBRER4_n2536 [Citrifermentans bremense]